ncbi:uncharacterized protein BYT42DRAFT_19392 [Radiomyces spectabilis]|uniref:uncharacterized protein n=1 Tax=Radiomyces spectabilis TaxID=64574 RepID=UPI0022202116|nr:uncharacterized protein BYT42DRAFT_19392 [Radiomyces spectabilis]KAI8393809.1 hypothetical protein BYT42DRAFT_19392 [Radiomyces spectabilis]
MAETHKKSSQSRAVMLESDSPDPSLLKVALLDPKNDYRELPWKNGLGSTSEISIYPPDKDYQKESFFWRFSIHSIDANCTYSLFPGYDSSIIVLPFDHERQQSLLLNHQGNEQSTSIKPLFPYTWKGEWATICKVTNPPIETLQFMINRDLGSAQFHVDKIGYSALDEGGQPGEKLLFGAFALLYVVEGYAEVRLDGEHSKASSHLVSEGQSLYVERDEDASPTSLQIHSADAFGNKARPGVNTTVITIEVSESPRSGLNTHKDRKGKSDKEQETSISNDAPSQRRECRRRSSLVPCEDQPLGNQPEIHAMGQRRRSSASDVIEELAATLKRSSFSSLDESLRRDSLAMLGGTYAPTQMYEPPALAAMDRGSAMPPPLVRDRLVIEDFAPKTTNTVWIKMMTQGLGEWIRVPVIVLRGEEDGPVVGITAAVHGNELNGVPCIHRVVSEIDVQKLKGTVVAVPCVNVAGYLKFRREFADGRDLNRMFPGKEDGFASQVYCYQLMHKIIAQLQYLVDLHTASFGRVNSYYVRADMNDPASAMLAKLQQPQIVLHNSGQDGTLRSAASARGIKAITVEIGNPQLFQNQYVQWAFQGVMHLLDYLHMYPLENAGKDMMIGPANTLLCSSGFWIYTKVGGVLEVYPGVNTIVSKGDLIGRIKNMFGNVVDEYFSPCTGIVIGRSSNPVAMAGDRIIHLGVIKRKGETLAKEAKENY